MKEQRKLAAIMFTDIVGYSAQMSKDERMALQLLSTNRELHKKALQKFNGEFIKEIGDGILSIFQSSWDAVCCAMELQHALGQSANFQLRIGIHQGDIVISEKDVFGSGVNIASRIQALCEPGGILISETVYNDIKNKPGIDTDCLGRKQLKNIDQSITIYSVTNDCIGQWETSTAETEEHEPGRKDQTIEKTRKKNSWKLFSLIIITCLIIIIGFIIFRPYFQRSLPESSRLPIAVITFENQTGDTSFNYLQKAIPNLLITNLEQSKLFQVITWERMHDVMKQMGKGDEKTIDPDLGFDICREEGCKFIVIGSYVRAGDIFATDAKVLDVETKKIISSVNSKGNNVGSILDTQIDALSKDISRSMGISAREIESAHMRILEVTTNSLEAYHYFLKGRESYNKYYWNEAIHYFERAIKIDPGFAMAYLYLSRTYLQLGDMRQYDDMLDKAYRASHRATENEQLYIHAAYAGIIQHDPQLQLNILLELSQKAPRDKKVFFALGKWYEKFGFIDKSIIEFKKVLELDPYNAETYNQVAYVYVRKGEIDKAIEYLVKYSSLNPEDANPFDSMGDLYWTLGNLDKAIEQFRKALEIKPETWYSAAKLAYIYAMKEDHRQANFWLSATLDAAPSESIKANIYWFIAFTDYGYGKLDQALLSLDKSEAIAKKYNYKQFYLVSYLLRAFIYYDREEYEKAQSQCRSFLILASQDPTGENVNEMGSYYFLKGLVSIKLNQPDSARIYLDRILPLATDPEQDFQYHYLMRELQIAAVTQPGGLDSIPRKINYKIPRFATPNVLIYNLPYLRNSLAEAYRRFGMHDKAIAEYEQLSTFDPSGNDRRLADPRYHYFLGILYQEKGLKDKAVEQFRKFLHLWQDADPIFSETGDARQRLAQLNNSR